MDLPQAEEYFQKYYDRLIKETLYARAHLKLWEQLEKLKATDYIDELNQAPHFFNFTIKAHLDDALLTLSRILDKNDGSLSIWKFLNFVEQNQEIFSTQAFHQRMGNNPDYDEHWTKSHKPIMPKEIQEDRDKLKKLEQTAHNLTTWRDKLIAHLDRSVITQEQFIPKDYPLRFQQLEEIVETLFQILNRYSNAFESSSYAESFVNEDDLQFIMDCIRFKIEEENEQIEAQLAALKQQANGKL